MTERSGSPSEEMGAIRPYEGEPDDAAIVARVLDGDVEAFGLLVDRYERELAAYARFALRSPDDAEDVMQEALVRAYRSLHRCGDPERFKGWLFRIVSNQCRSHLTRRRRREERHESVDDREGELAAEAADPLEQTQQADRRARLEEALEELGGDQREALVLHYVNGLSVRELADALGLSNSAAKMRLHRAREALRQVLEGEPA